MLIDKFNRSLQLIEIEVSGQSQWHSDFCRPAVAVETYQLFATEHLARFLSAMGQLGLERIRLVGGESLLRPDIIKLVAALTVLPRLKPLELVTNGIELPRLAGDLCDAGLRKVTVLMPSRSSAVFHAMTGCDRELTEAGIAAAREAHLGVRIKMPLVAGVNEDEVEPVYRWAAERGFGLKIVQARSPNDDTTIHAINLENSLAAAGAKLSALPTNDAHLWLDSQGGELVKIATFDTRSCMDCNRFWIGCDGVITLCDGLDSFIDLAEIFDEEPSETDLFNFASKISLNKPKTDRCACTRSPTARI